MRVEWTDKEVVFIPDVGTVGPGTIFNIEDNRGQDLVTRGAARLVVEPKFDTPQQKTTSAIEKGLAKPVAAIVSGQTNTKEDT